MKRLTQRVALVVAVLNAAPVTGAPATGSSLVLVDDRGEMLAEGAVEVCFRKDLERRCQSAPGGGRLMWPEGVEAAEIQGPEHGPVRVEPSELRLGAEGFVRVVVPRKARLRVIGEPGGGSVTVSLYRAADPVLRVPAFRYRSSVGEVLRVPAGEHLVSIVGEGGAPDLGVVELLPAREASISYTERPGWSLVVRIVEAASGSPVAGVDVEARLLAPVDDGGDRPPPIGHERTGELGLALMTGIEATYVDLAGRHSAFVEAGARGISATQGTFAVRELQLRPGGSVVAQVRGPDGAAAGVQVEVREPAERPSTFARSPAVVAAGETDRQGRWKAAKVPAGAYTVRIRPVESEAHLEREVTVVDGEELALEVALEPVEIRGMVYRGTEAAGEGYRVELSAAGLGLDGHAVAEPAATAVTDAEGRFEATVWEVGSYEAMLLSPGYVPVSRRRVELYGGDEEIEFYLEAGSVAGQVVDEDGRGVDAAMVLMSWNDSRHTSVGTLEGGYFSLPVDSAGTARLEARKPGYEGSEVAIVEVLEGSEPAPVVLVLRRAAGILGVVRGAPGRPLVGVTVASFGLGGGEGRFLGATETGPDGRFEVPRAPEGLTRVFALGLECPLTWTEVAPAEEGEDVVIGCPAAPATLDLRMIDGEGRPRRGEFVRVRRGEVVVPQGLLQGHLARLGLPIESDGEGRLVVPSLTPGRYELFLASASSAASVRAGAEAGFVANVEVGVLETAELEITVEAER